MNELWETTSGRLLPALSEKVNVVLNAKKNLDKVVNILSDYDMMETKLSDIEARIQSNEDCEYFYVYKELKKFNFLQCRLTERIKREGLDEDAQRLERIEAKFKLVSNLQQQFYDRLYSTIKNTYTMAKDNPVALVRVLRIIENDELANKSLEKNY